VYDITVENPQHVSRGVRSLEVDGAMIPGNNIPLSNGKHTIRAVIEG
jgi:hypothetical protein